MDRKTEAALELLYKTALDIRTHEEAQFFFKTLLTEKETQLIAQRLYVAKLLSENKVYTEIVDETGASSATVSRVKRAMAADKDYFERMLAGKNEQL